MTVLSLILAILAVYRLAHAIALEDGPFDIFAKVRDGLQADKQATWLQRGAACPLCISFWLALPAAWLIGGGLLEWLGIAGAVMVLHIVLYR